MLVYQPNDHGKDHQQHHEKQARYRAAHVAVGKQRYGQEDGADPERRGQVRLVHERAKVGGEGGPGDAETGADGGEYQCLDHGAESAAGVAWRESIGRVEGGARGGIYRIYSMAVSYMCPTKERTDK